MKIIVPVLFLLFFSCKKSENVSLTSEPNFYLNIKLNGSQKILSSFPLSTTDNYQNCLFANDSLYFKCQILSEDNFGEWVFLELNNLDLFSLSYPLLLPYNFSPMPFENNHFADIYFRTVINGEVMIFNLSPGVCGSKISITHFDTKSRFMRGEFEGCLLGYSISEFAPQFFDTIPNVRGYFKIKVRQ